MKIFMYLSLALTLVCLYFGYYYAWAAQTCVPKSEYLSTISQNFGIGFYIFLAITIFQYIRFRRLRKMKNDNTVSQPMSVFASFSRTWLIYFGLSALMIDGKWFASMICYLAHLALIFLVLKVSKKNHFSDTSKGIVIATICAIFVAFLNVLLRG